MINEHSIDFNIKCEPKDDLIYPSQDKDDTKLVHLENAKVYNITHHAVEIKKENTIFDTENSCCQSLKADHSNVKMIEFVNVKIEPKDDYDAEKSTSDNIIDPIATKNGSFICNYCKRAFTTADYYHKHIRRCKSRVYDQPSTSSHNVLVAAVLDKKAKPSKDQEGLYQCDHCDNKYKSLDGLNQHARKHSSVGLHICSECNKQFIRPVELAKHMLIHTKEKPHKCTQCDAEFNRVGNLKTHMLTHSGEKPYKCSQCGKSFAYLGDLMRHIRTHTGEKPYKCTQCDKSFTQSNNLILHMRTHTGERPYKCSLCVKSFTLSSNLTKHIITHTGEKPYQCIACGRTFTVKKSLNRHVLNTHGSEKNNKL